MSQVTMAPPICLVDLRNPQTPSDALGSSQASVSRRAITLTLFRLPIVAAGVTALFVGEPVVAVLLFVCFAAVDLLDGIIARRDSGDNPSRRALDVVVDRVSIHVASLACVVIHGSELGIAIALMARDLVQAAYSGKAALVDRVVFVGPRWHMLYGLAFLAWGSYFSIFGRVGTELTIVLAIISVATLVDFIRLTRRTVSHRRIVV